MSSNKTIAKNTLFLYFRMILVMGVSLFTSRIVLQELGISDYGIYSLVGGIVALFGFFNAAMSSATQRYLSFDIGKGDQEKLRKTFSASLTIHAGIALLVLILAETIGLWYVNYKMVFPPERNFAVNVVYQFSIFSFLLGIIQVPYNALIIARERMNVYAYVSILEVILKLIIVFLLVYFGSDKLITYAILTFVVSFIIRVIYQVYCRKHFKESKYKFEYDKEYYRELMSYSGWNMFGSLAMVARGQGSNILLNLFFGTVANAAYGITMVVQGAVQGFVSNFQMAVNPQIIKNYARGDMQQSLNMIYQSAKLSFFVMLILVVPFLVNIEYIINLWLKEVPPHSIDFIRLALVSLLIDTISGPLVVGAQATGKIKLYQIVIGSFLIMTFPITYILFKYFHNPYVLFWVFIVNALVSLIFRTFFLRNMIGLKIKDFFMKVMSPIIVVSALVLFLYSFFNYKAEDFYQFVVQSLLCGFVILLLTFYFGLNVKERIFVIQAIKKKLLNR